MRNVMRGATDVQEESTAEMCNLNFFLSVKLFYHENLVLSLEFRWSCRGTPKLKFWNGEMSTRVDLCKYITDARG